MAKKGNVAQASRRREHRTRQARSCALAASAAATAVAIVAAHGIGTPRPPAPTEVCESAAAEGAERADSDEPGDRLARGSNEHQVAQLRAGQVEQQSREAVWCTRRWRHSNQQCCSAWTARSTADRRSCKAERKARGASRQLVCEPRASSCGHARPAVSCAEAAPSSAQRVGDKPATGSARAQTRLKDAPRMTQAGGGRQIQRRRRCAAAARTAAARPPCTNQRSSDHCAGAPCEGAPRQAVRATLRH